MTRPVETPYDSWAGIYDSVYSYVTHDIDFYVEEAVEAGGPVLELGCGTGRITLPIAQAGVDIVGLDYSKPMLEAASLKLAALNDSKLRVRLTHGDMRDFDLEGRFQLAIIPFRGFMALMSVADQSTALLNIKKHLAPGGRLIFNVFVPDPEMLNQAGDTPFHFRDVTDPDTGERHVIWQQSSYDHYQQHIAVRLTIETLDLDGVVKRKMYRDFPLRYTYHWEMHHLLRLCGFEILDVYGDFDMSPFDEFSTEMIWVVQPST